MIPLKVVSDDFAVFHHEANAFEFGDVRERITGDGNKIGKFPRLDRSDAICQPNMSAALMVMARITSRDGIPASRKLTKVAVLACPRVFPG